MGVSGQDHDHQRKTRCKPRSAQPLTVPNYERLSDETNISSGDIILRSQSSSGRGFRIHKLVFSLASPVYRYPPTRVISAGRRYQGRRYARFATRPLSHPKARLSVPSVQGQQPGAPGRRSYHRRQVPDRRRACRLRGSLNKLIGEAPLRVYAIASRFGFDEEMDIAASFTTNISLP